MAGKTPLVSFPHIRYRGDLGLHCVLLTLKKFVENNTTFDRAMLEQKSFKYKPRPSRQGVAASVQLLRDDNVLVVNGPNLRLDMDKLEERMEIYNETP